MPGFETAHEVVDKTVDSTKALAELKEELVPIDYTQTPNEFLKKNFKMQDFVNWLFDAGLDIAELSALINEKLPEGQEHTSLDIVKFGGPMEINTIDGTEERTWAVKLHPEGHPYRRDPNGKKAIGGNYKIRFGWREGVQKAILNFIARKTSVHIPKEKYEKFFSLFKRRLAKTKGVVSEEGKKKMELNNDHMGGVRRSLEQASEVINKNKKKEEERRQEEGKKMEEDKRKKEWEDLGPNYAKNKAKEEEKAETARFIGRQKGTAEAKAAKKAEAKEAGLMDSKEEHEAKKIAEQTRIDAAIEQREEDAKKAAKAKARADRRARRKKK